jgi:hypothetical protein
VTRLCPEGEAVEIWGDWDTLGVSCTPGDTLGMPSRGFIWRGASHRITGVYNRWRIHTNWWQQGLPVSALSPLKAGIWREYLKVTTDSGLLCLLFRDLEDGRGIPAGGREILAEGQGTPAEEGDAWYLARIYD